MTLATGTTLHNRYRIVKLVGQGGFGAVYRGWDTALNRAVAVKENIDTGPESQRQFEREAQLLANLRHPNLPVVIDHFILPGQGQYLVMDFVEGKSLAALLAERGGPLGEAEALPWIRQVADALEYLHTRTPPIIHRDIKPENIIVTVDGRAMLVDFGISKLYDPSKGTTIGAKAVTPGYSPPEQYGRGRTDPRSDVYSLGATLYTLLTGEIPPEAPDLSSGADTLVPPREINPTVSEQASQAVMAAMTLSISQRLGSAAGLGERLSVTPQRKPTPPPPIVPSTSTVGSTVQQGKATSAAGGARRGVPVWGLVVAMVAMGLVAWLWIALNGRNINESELEATAEVASSFQLVPTGTAEAITEAASASETALTRVTTETEVEGSAVEAGDDIGCAAADALCIGLVTDVGQVDDKSFNQSAWEGAQQAAEALGATEVNYIETRNFADYAANIDLFAGQGYDIIVTVGFIMGEATLAAAQTYPDIDFIGVDQFQAETVPNLTGLIFHEDKAGYLAGVLAASLTESGTIASVLGTDMVPTVVAFNEGFHSGARSVNPDINIIATYHPGGLDVAFTDPEWGAVTAQESIDLGADVIFGAGGLTGNGALIQTAGNPGLWCIGVDTDQWKTLPEAHPCLVSSAMKLITPGVVDLATASGNGRFPGGNFFGQVGLASFHDHEAAVSQEIRDLLSAKSIGLQDGSIDTGYSHGG